jgi:FtsZ-interacting cell division protein ZipA
MRRDLLVMSTIAAVAGIGLAALLTASFGSHSAGSPAALKPVVKNVADAPTPRSAAKTRRLHRRHAHRRHANPSPRIAPPAPAPATTVAEAPYQSTTQSQQAIQDSQPVYTPPPQPAPVVKQLSRPTRPKNSGGGGTFDDSG